MTLRVLIVIGVVAVGLAGCTANHPTASTGPATKADASSSGAAPMTPTPTSTSISSSAVTSPTRTASSAASGPVVGPSGSALASPPSPLVLTASDDCHALIPDRSARVTSCATATSSRGTITAVEVADGMSTYVYVYRRSGDQAVEVLRSTPEVGTTGPAAWRIASIDPEHDGNPKIAVVLLGEPGDRVRGYDLVDVPGTVTLHRELGDGAVALASGGGLTDWQVEAKYIRVSTIRYSIGQWRVAVQQDGQQFPSVTVGF